MRQKGALNKLHVWTKYYLKLNDTKQFTMQNAFFHTEATSLTK